MALQTPTNPRTLRRRATALLALTLSPSERDVVTQFYNNLLSIDEVAARLGMTPPQVADVIDSVEARRRERNGQWSGRREASPAKHRRIVKRRSKTL